MLSYLVLARSALGNKHAGSDTNGTGVPRADLRRRQLIHRLYGMIS